jgi:hypothetical protein
MLITNLYERNNGSEKGDNKARLCWRESKRTSEKKDVFFLEGEVFFLLTGSLMGDTKALTCVNRCQTNALIKMDTKAPYFPRKVDWIYSSFDTDSD